MVTVGLLIIAPLGGTVRNICPFNLTVVTTAAVPVGLILETRARLRVATLCTVERGLCRPRFTLRKTSRFSFIVDSPLGFRLAFSKTVNSLVADKSPVLQDNSCLWG